METPTIIILIRSDAPAKPAMGSNCNGCGVCCLYQPCPLGMMLSGRRSGSCAAVYWNDALRAYRCGAVDRPLPVLQSSLPRPLQALAPVLARPLAAAALRWIAAAKGCDSSLQVLDATMPAGEAAPLVGAANDDQP